MGCLEGQPLGGPQVRAAPLPVSARRWRRTRSWAEPVAFVVMCDASVLHPSTLHDLLIRVPQSGLVPPKWTEQILDEMVGALKRDRSPVIARPRCEWHVNGTCDLGVIAGAGRRETWSCLTSTRPQGRHSGGSGGAPNAMGACLPVADMAAQVADMSARCMVRRSADRGPSGPHTDEGVL